MHSADIDILSAPTSSDEGFRLEHLNNDDFDAAEYISRVLSGLKPGEDTRQLNKLKQQLLSKSNVTSEAIKNIVFDHYKHFIEASRNVSALESNIYQLSKSLSEQKAVIKNLMELCGHEKEKTRESNLNHASIHQQKEMQCLMQKIDGIAIAFNSMKDGEKIMLHSKMFLLNTDTLEPKNPIYIVLLSNNLLIAHPSPTSNSIYPFTLSSNHRLSEIAVVNFKSSTKSATSNKQNCLIIQLLIFPEQMFIKCDSAFVKRDWLDCIEELKRQQQEIGALVRQATIRAKRHSILTSLHSNISGKSKTNEFSELDAEDEEIDGIERSNDTQWLKELVTELHDVISHRHMDQAIEMIMEWKSCRCRDPIINTEFQALERMAVQILSDDLQRSDPSGGSRRISLALQQLTALNRGVYAMDLYLKRRSSTLRTSIKDLPISEEPLFYVRQVSSTVVNDIIEVLKQCDSQPNFYPLILFWSSKELSTLISLIRQNVFESTPTMAVLAHTWRIFTTKCSTLASNGLDLTFLVNRLAAPSLRVALEINFKSMFESIQAGILEEKWKPFNLENEQNLNRFLEEMSDLELSLDWAISTDTSLCFRKWSLNVTQNVCNFARTVVSLCHDFSVLNTPYLHKMLDSFMTEVWNEYLKHLSYQHASDEEPSFKEIRMNSCKFIFTQVVPLCDQIYSQNAFIGNLIVKNFPTLSKHLSSTYAINQQQGHFAAGSNEQQDGGYHV